MVNSGDKRQRHEVSPLARKKQRTEEEDDGNAFNGVTERKRKRKAKQVAKIPTESEENVARLAEEEDSGAVENTEEGDQAAASSTPAENTTMNAAEAMDRRRRRRNSKLSRRLSLTPATKSKQYITDMYSTIIKMSSENKINSKNSWSLHLIDHIDDILVEKRQEDASPTDTYNFQKASCTLDASVKIYSYRVDDTWNSSFKVLENLTRGDEVQEDDVDEESASQRRTSTKKMSTANTLETNLSHINMKSVDLEFQMSQAFDEGGAKGMLMVNLSVHDGCKIMLDSSDVMAVPQIPTPIPEEPKEEPTEKPLINISSLAKRLRAGPVLAESLDICPKLEHFYDQLIAMDHDFFEKKVSVPRLDFASSQLSRPRRLTMLPVEKNEDEEAEDYDMGMGHDDDDYEPSEYVPTPGPATPAAPMSAMSARSDVGSAIDEEQGEDEEPIAKPLMFDGVEEEEEDNILQDAPAESLDNQNLHMLESALLRSVDAEEMDEYSFFDAKSLKNWAGPSHWKLKLRGVPKKAPKKPSVRNTTTPNKPEASSRKKKEEFSFDATESEQKQAFQLPKSKISLRLSKATVNRYNAQAAVLVYPADLRTKVQEFYQLFTRPPTATFGSAGSHDVVPNFHSTSNSSTFGQSAPVYGPFLEETDIGLDFGGGDDIDHGQGDYNVEGLLQADRIVDKVDIQYEKFAKRVDVKKLKESIWSKLPFHEPEVENEEESKRDEAMEALTEEAKKMSVDEVVSFEEMVHNVAPDVPRNVTVSFYFICMLHLANDKGLELEGQENLEDFTIRKSAPSNP
ncbi:condensin complex subunit 2 [Thraustotheca clavata]|uniref:Condensin complex subunit 2 n=1 Tax=Thraustotheca clavata TaxID=74557 RepID=A0A1V9ZXS7_9STRA|nr:condensin complex subunit 2 [Thraustotheca clavata]